MSDAALPETAQVVADIIGREGALALARACKCRSLYIPKRLPLDHWLRDVVGDAHAEALSKEFPGFILPMAKCANVIRAERDKRILSMRREGMSAATIAARIGVAERTVYTVVCNNVRQ
ncbi:hypothetical protein [Desulfovibrio subterraneus]|jgi:hypothetical protein|uniref:Mor transcription activator domain-containing protein n=1 Tax=Desulfovibrio subterraneus TaxID=2718620 RepID=A0A7J0BLE3_9BACT|nr:hypothetical protein [Desulfovibrio subterraneus]GFM34042.1 hypothetical protein DSM101010T_24070 [Desulfovibrio subterraneus]